MKQSILRSIDTINCREIDRAARRALTIRPKLRRAETLCRGARDKMSGVTPVPHRRGLPPVRFPATPGRGAAAAPRADAATGQAAINPENDRIMGTGMAKDPR